MDDELNLDVARRVGPKAAKALASLEIHTVGDLLRHYPRRYIQRGELTDLAALPDDVHVTVLAQVLSAKTHAMRGRPGWRVVVSIDDGQPGSNPLDLVFFTARQWQRDRLLTELAVGKTALFSGKVTRYQGRRQLAHPRYDVLPVVDEQAARELAVQPIPVYAATSGIQSWQIQAAMDVILTGLSTVPDVVPDSVRAKHHLLDALAALRAVHQPDTMDQADQARQRLKFEEAFVLQTALLRRRMALLAVSTTARHPVPRGALAAFDDRLPFQLTQGQREVGKHITADLARTQPMHRLLQGEVGSGKTIVALRAMLAVVDAGGQAALLAPTEVLAAQHYRSITAMLGDLAERGLLGGADVGTRVALLTGSQSASTRRAQLLAAASGEAGIVIGTHALLADHVQFADLGLVVIDEQHRFGVEQRDVLRAKAGVPPHVLVMTATPIPRTVAMTVFGDLETSVLTELPAGRAEIVTHVVPGDHPRWMSRVWARVAEEVAAGRQAFVVCPRIDPDGDEPALTATVGIDCDPALFNEAPEPARSLAAVLEVTQQLCADPTLAGVRIAALHGRMPAEDRERVMSEFAVGEIDVLVATTVIEVGVDVPNATVMVVLDADRFGVSQLHQVRGRVGRGSHPGLALFVTTTAEDALARERLTAVASTTDGFVLARLDLEQRREGDVLGASQAGYRSSLRLLRVLRDEKIIVAARHEAADVLRADPDLTEHQELGDAVAALAGSGRDAYLERG
ncbi:MAG: ATP-dependent DNA helicase RecG [Actinomycetota bacterium]